MTQACILVFAINVVQLWLFLNVILIEHGQADTLFLCVLLSRNNSYLGKDQVISSLPMSARNAALIIEAWN